VAAHLSLIRAGFREILAHDPSIELVGEAENVSETIALLRSREADVVMVCAEIAGPRIAVFVRQLRAAHPALAILVMTLRPTSDVGVEAFRVGAAGFICKDSTEAELLAAVKTVAAGRRYVSREMADALAGAVGDTERSRVLSPRENAVLAGLVEGRSHKQIAAELDVSHKSIGTYRSRVLRKLGLRTTADLIRYAVRREG
jgi:DNA-binding NarL/FixJ family response regulator